MIIYFFQECKYTKLVEFCDCYHLKKFDVNLILVNLWNEPALQYNLYSWIFEYPIWNIDILGII